MTSAMLRYSYIKSRNQFGKQCIFEYNYNVGEATVLPNEHEMGDFIVRTKIPRHTQMSAQLAGHEVTTNPTAVKNTGMLHVEGGWPKEINRSDTESVQRYCRRIERSDNWVSTLKRLLPPMEHCVKQNGTLNIHEEYFDNLIVTTIAKYYDIRIKNSYADPEPMKRPVRHLSWGASGSNRLAAAYAYMEYDRHADDVSPYSYIWDIGTRIFLMLFDDEPHSIWRYLPRHLGNGMLSDRSDSFPENSNAPLCALKSASPIVSIEFNPRDPALLVGGLLSGQVCCWDMRTHDLFGQLSHPFYSHRRPVTNALWIPTKANTEYFSTSIGGTVKWWDLRQPSKPSETLVMDLDQPNRADIVRSIGVSALQYEHTISSRFLAGMENGLIINVNRKSPNLVEKLASRYKCYAGPVIAIDRNPISLKNFLTIGNGSAEVWGEDTRESCYFTVCDEKAELCGGCWSTSRCSVFFTVNTKGVLKAYDVLGGMNAPLMAIQLCQYPLTSINMHEEGEFLAVGSRDGNIYLLQCSEDLTVFTKEDRSHLSNYLERCSRFEKALETRMKEIRLLQDLRQEEEDEYMQRQMMKVKGKKKETKMKKRDTRNSRDSISKRKIRKGRGTRRWSTPMFEEAEAIYFRSIEEETAKFAELDEEDMEAAQELLKNRISVRHPEEKVKETDKEESKKEKGARKSHGKVRDRRRKMTDLQKKEDIVIVETDSDGAGSTRKRRKKILKKICETKICKPEICCQDMEDRGEKQQQEVISYKMTTKIPEKMKLSLMENKLFKNLTLEIDQIPSMPALKKKKALILKDMAPTVLKMKLQLAKEEIRLWQEKALAGTLCSWSVERKLDEERKRKALEEMEKEKESARTKEAQPKRVSIQKDSHATKKQKVKQKQKPKKKQKDVEPTEEELRREKEQKRKQLFEQMKLVAKECYGDDTLDVTYPRISSAFVKNFSKVETKTDEETDT